MSAETSRATVEKTILSAIAALNEELPEEQRLGLSPEAGIYGDSGRLDSLGLVNLIVAVEGALLDDLDLALTLADERAMSMRNSPFRTVASLTDFICLRLEEERA